MNNNEDSNMLELTAWNQWKEICSVTGCSDKNQQILNKQIIGAFRKKFHRYCKNERDGILNSVPRNGDGFHWAHEFDIGITEKAELANTKKNYKDYTWHLINESDDPPLKVIRGILLGPRGIINTIAENYLRNNYYEVWVRAEKDIKAKSLNESLSPDDENNQKLEDVIGQEPTSATSSEGEEALKNAFDGLLTNIEAAILLAHISNISLASKELSEYTGFKKVFHYDRWNNDIQRKIKNLPEEVREIIHKENTALFIIELLERQLSPEKSAENLLRTAEAKRMKRFNQEDGAYDE